MNRPARIIGTRILRALPGLLFLLGVGLDVQAAPVTDTFPLKVTGKEWCRDNPKFFETFHVKAKDDITITVTRDVNADDDFTDISATINNTGSADIDAMTLNGLAFPSNQSGSKAKFDLLGTLNNGHFFALQGQAHLDKQGNLTKMTGTFLYQITGTYTLDKQGNQSDPVDCFANGTFVTGKSK